MDIRTDRLQKAFIDSGLSQTEVCERVGITKGAMSSYLSGRYFPKQRVVDKLAEVLHVSVLYLMGYDDPSSSASDKSTSADPAEMLLLSAFRDLNAAGREMLCNYAEYLLSNDKYKKVS